MEQLKFRRQFFIYSGKITTNQYWKISKLNKFHKDCYIYSHIDLEINVVSNGSVALFLLGYIIDPYHPERGNQEVLDDLIKSRSFDDLLLNSESLGGRFVLVYSTKDTIKIFHDTTGFRELYYHVNSPDLVCGSTPNVINNFFPIEKDDDPDLNDFFKSPELNNREKVWIGTRTIYKGIRKLLPNHYLDLVNKRSHRFWPIKERESKSLRELAVRCAKILQGTYDCAVRRYKLQHSLTSGWESRFLLSGARNYIHDMEFYYNRGSKRDVGKDSVDYLVAKEIAEKYKLSMSFIDVSNIEVDPGFEKIYIDNHYLSRQKLLKIFYDLHLKKLDNTVTVSGTMGNEILRLYSSLHRNADKADVIADMIGYRRFPYIIESINEWLESSRHLKEKKYKLVDLFFWEQYFGNWGVLGGTEQDIIREELRPMNNRELVSLFLSVPDNARYRDYPKAYVKTIKMLWPELLRFNMDITNYKLKMTLRFLGLEQFTEKMYQILRS